MSKDRISKKEISNLMSWLAKRRHKKNPVDPEFMSKISRERAKKKKLSTDKD